MSLLRDRGRLRRRREPPNRPGVVVINRDPEHPTAEVVAIVSSSMVGDPAKPPAVIVYNRQSPSDQREGFTPFDRHKHISLWVEPADRYPETGAKTWQQELALSAAHEDYHFRHPGQPCPDGSCEIKAEAYAHSVIGNRYAHAVG